MRNILVYPLGSTKAIAYGAEYLASYSVPVTDQPSPEVTHLLLDVPSFDAEGHLRNGSDISSVLKMLPQDVTVIGGNINHPSLSGYSTYDLLQQEDYQCQNAAITAHCALRIALENLQSTLTDSPSLIIGWGRIGKCLAQLLKQNGADVWLSIRNPKDRALAKTLGYYAIPSPLDVPEPAKIRILFNTVPQLVMDNENIHTYKHCIKIDLASVPGLEGEDVIVARGLPGKYAPESSGKLIAKNILNFLKEE